VKRHREKRRREFSKVILTTITVATCVVVALSFVLMFKTMDLSPLAYIIPGCFAELASATGFYYWKAKNENMIKLGLLPQTDPADKEGGAVG